MEAKQAVRTKASGWPLSSRGKPSRKLPLLSSNGSSYCAARRATPGVSTIAGNHHVTLWLWTSMSCRFGGRHVAACGMPGIGPARYRQAIGVFVSRCRRIRGCIKLVMQEIAFIWASLFACLVVNNEADEKQTRKDDIIAEKSGLSRGWVGLILLAAGAARPGRGT